MLQARHFPMPIGKTRLYISIFMAFVSGVFIYFGSTNFGWLTLTRVIYFLFGVTAGVLLGVVETRIVIPKLVKDTEAFVWQVVPIGAALFGVPLLVIAFFGVPEYLPFGVYAFFPFITATGAASGWYFNKFEKENKVDVFMFYYGFKYWKQPNPDVTERFHYFLRDVAKKDPSQFWTQLGSSLNYIGYTNAFRDKLEEKQEIDPSTRENLLKILKTMNTFRTITLAIFALFLVSFATLMILLFGSAFGYFQFNFNIVDVVGPASGIVLFGFLIGVFVLMKTFQRKISRLLNDIDTSKLTLPPS
jgi:hypothetical protein